MFKCRFTIILVGLLLAVPSVSRAAPAPLPRPADLELAGLWMDEAGEVLAWPDGLMNIRTWDSAGARTRFEGNAIIETRERDAAGVVIRIRGRIALTYWDDRALVAEDGGGGTGEFVAERRSNGTESLSITFQAYWSDDDGDTETSDSIHLILEKSEWWSRSSVTINAD